LHPNFGQRTYHLQAPHSQLHRTLLFIRHPITLNQLFIIKPTKLPRQIHRPQLLNMPLYPCLKLTVRVLHRLAREKTLAHYCHVLLGRAGFGIRFVDLFFFGFEDSPFVQILDIIYPLIDFHLLPLQLNINLLLLIRHHLTQLRAPLQLFPLDRICLIHQ